MKEQYGLEWGFGIIKFILALKLLNIIIFFQQWFSYIHTHERVEAGSWYCVLGKLYLKEDL